MDHIAGCQNLTAPKETIQIYCACFFNTKVKLFESNLLCIYSVAYLRALLAAAFAFVFAPAFGFLFRGGGVSSSSSSSSSSPSRASAEASSFGDTSPLPLALDLVFGFGLDLAFWALQFLAAGLGVRFKPSYLERMHI